MVRAEEPARPTGTASPSTASTPRSSATTARPTSSAGRQYVRYSGDDYTRVDDRYPKTITGYWGNVVNPITRSGHVDAALVLQSPPEVEGGAGADAHLPVLRPPVRPVRGHRLRDRRRRLPARHRHVAARRAAVREPDRRSRRAGSTPPSPTGAPSTCSPAARCHVVSAALYRSYDAPRPAPRRLRLPRGRRGARRGRGRAGTGSARSRPRSSRRRAVRPRALRSVPEHFRTGLDAVLDGVGRQHLPVQGPDLLRRRAGPGVPDRRGLGPPAQHRRGRARASTPRSSGRDGKTYVFGGDQFVTYAGAAYAGVEVDGHPAARRRALGRPHRASALAYVHARRHLPVRAAGRGGEPPLRRVLRLRLHPARTRATRRSRAPTSGASRRSTAARSRSRSRCCSTGTTRCTSAGTQYVQHNAASGAWSYPRPLARLWPGLPLGTASAPAADRLHRCRRRDVLLLPRRVHPLRGRAVLRARADPSRGGAGSGTPSPRPPGTTAVDAAFVWRGRRPTCSPATSTSATPARATATSTPATRSRSSTTCATRSASRHLPEAFEEALADRVAAGEQTVIDAVLANRPHRLPVRRPVPARRVAEPGGHLRPARARPGPQQRGRHRPGGRVLRHAASRRSCSPATSTCATPAPSTRSSTRATRAASPRALPDEVGVDGAARGVPRRDRRRDRRRRTAGCTCSAGGSSCDTGGARAGRPAGRRDVGPGAQPVRSTTPTTTASTRRSSPATGSLFAFKGDQYLRYRDADGRARGRRLPPLDQGRLGRPPDRRSRPGWTRAFVFEGATYFVRGEQYVRYSGGDLRRIDRTYPQPLGAPMGSVGGLPARRPARHRRGSSSCRTARPTATAAWPRC